MNRGVYQVDHWLKHATRLLDASQVPSARLDALILLEDALDKDRAYLLAYPETPVQGATLEKLDKRLARRAAHEPLAYIRGKSYFYGREFLVTPATLQPRPETETMITLLKNLLQHKTPNIRVGPSKNGKDVVIVDVGTGSGCLAITAKLELPEAAVYATEINEDALKVARKNAKKLTAEVKFYKSNLLEPLLRSPFPIHRSVLVANLPYVPDSHTINKAAMQEPAIAIFGGEDGLDLYRRMFEQIKGLGSKPGYIFTESLPFQHMGLTSIAKSAGYQLADTEDFIQVFSLPVLGP